MSWGARCEPYRGSLPWYSVFSMFVEVAAMGPIVYFQIFFCPVPIPATLYVPGTSFLFFFLKSDRISSLLSSSFQRTIKLHPGIFSTGTGLICGMLTTVTSTF